MNQFVMRLILMTIALVTVGCTVGPNYVPPAISFPAAYLESPKKSKSLHASTSEMWWKDFGDPVLDDLIARASEMAPNILEAEARVREARAIRGIEDADQFPSAAATSEYRRSHGSDGVPTGVTPGGLGPGKTSNLYQIGFDSSWEIDIFGERRRALESADADYLAALDDQGSALLTLYAEVARNYIEIRTAQRQLDVAKANLSLQQDALAIATAQVRAGLASDLDKLRAEAQVADTEATIPSLYIDSHTALYRLAALIGLPPESLLVLIDEPRPIPNVPREVPAGLPSDLLKRRPDVAAAEQRVRGANARIGLAEADYYPHFSLTGIGGLESLQFSSFKNSSSGYYSLGPNFRWLIFDAGAVHFEVLAARARTDAASAAYRRIVSDALRDVETALATYGRSEIRREHLADEVASQRKAVDIANRLYRQGLEDFLPVLDAERSLEAADDKLALSERDQALALIALYKALGGGWQQRPSSP